MITEYQTPQDLYRLACELADFIPEIDVCATEENTMCGTYINKEMDFFKHIFTEDHGSLWCNPPHDETKKFVLFLNDIWEKFNLDILMIIPANAICTKYFSKVYKNVQIFPIFYRPKFLQNGKLTKFPSRNSYFIVIWDKE